MDMGLRRIFGKSRTKWLLANITVILTGNP